MRLYSGDTIRPLLCTTAHSLAYHCIFDARRGLLSIPLFSPLSLHLCRIAPVSLSAHSLPPIGWHIAVYSRGLLIPTPPRVHPLYASMAASVPLRSLTPSVSLGLGIHLGHRPPLASLWCSPVRPHVDSRSFPGGCSLRSRSFLPALSRGAPYSESTTHVRPITLATWLHQSAYTLSTLADVDRPIVRVPCRAKHTH